MADEPDQDEATEPTEPINQGATGQRPNGEHAARASDRHPGETPLSVESESDPFAVHVDGPAGRERLLASAVVDASGTWTSPNPLGADGYPALGETENAARITYGIPDFRDPAVLIGGADNLEKQLESGELQKQLGK